jgi:hypothetical protein
MGGFIVTIGLDLHYSLYIAPIVFLLQPPPHPIKAIERNLLVLFHIGIGSPSTIYHHLNLLPSHSPLPQGSTTQTHTHTVPILQS